MKRYSLVDLFAGIGGVSLAGDHAGFNTTAFCEIDPFCQSILKKHWPEVPIFNDVRTLDRAAFVAQGIHSIDLLHASTPCQPFSTAGQQRAEQDERALWPNVLRIIRECQPRAILIENVGGAVRLALDLWLGGMEREGYDAGTLVCPAASVGAPHRRDRLFILAYSPSARRMPATAGRTNVQHIHRTRGLAPKTGIHGISESGVVGMADGLPAWIHGTEPERVIPERDPHHGKRLKALGNAVVPAQVWPILTVIHEMLTAVDAGAEADR